MDVVGTLETNEKTGFTVKKEHKTQTDFINLSKLHEMQNIKWRYKKLWEKILQAKILRPQCISGGSVSGWISKQQSSSAIVSGENKNKKVFGA